MSAAYLWLALVCVGVPQVLGVLEAVWRRGDTELEKALYGHAAAVTAK